VLYAFVCVPIYPVFTVCDEYLGGVLGGDMADTVVMSALARRYAIKMVIFMRPKTDAMDTTQAKRRTMLRGWHIAPEGIGGRPKNLFILATHLHVQHFEPIVPFNACTHQPGRFRRMTERDREGYCPVLGIEYTNNGQHRQVRSCGSNAPFMQVNSSHKNIILR
jgi:hypothetical protein